MPTYYEMLLAEAAKDPNLSVSTKKQLEVSKAAYDKQKQFNADIDIEMYQIAAAQNSDLGANTRSELEQDLIDLPRTAFLNKYGLEGMHLLDRYIDQKQQVFQDATVDRSLGEIASDSGIGVATGAVNLAAGVGSLATMPLPEVSAAIAGGNEAFNQAMHEYQSSGSQRDRRLQTAKNTLVARDAEAQWQQDIQNADTDFDKVIVGLEKLSTEVIGSTKNLSATGATNLIAEAVGSLGAAGKVAQGVGKVGNMVTSRIGSRAAVGPSSLAAQRADAFADAARWPTAIALTESGGTYQATVNELMNMPIETLRENPGFNELVANMMVEDPSMTQFEAEFKARANLGADLGSDAALRQAPIAALAGTLTRGLEKPFKVGSTKAALTNIGFAEPVEEAIQGGTSQLLTNMAVQEVDPSRELGKGVGEQIAYGAIGGFGAAGAMQSPVLAARAAGATAVGAVKGTLAVGGAIGKYALNKITAEEAKVAEQTQTTTNTVLSEAATDVTEINQAIDTAAASPEMADNAKVATDALYRVLGSVDPVSLSLDQYPEDVRQSVEGSENSVVAIHNLVNKLNETKDPQQRLIIGGLLSDILNQFDAVHTQNQEALKDVPTTEPAFEKYNRALSIVQGMREDPLVKRTFQDVEKLMGSMSESMTAPTAEQANTPQGQAQIQSLVAGANIAPDKGNLGAIRATLKMADDKIITLTPAQQAALQTSAAILESAKAFQTKVEQNGNKRHRDVVTGQIFTRDRQLDDQENGKKSGVEFAKQIYRAYMANDTEQAKYLMSELSMFVQHMQNKVDAFNRHYEQFGQKGIMNGNKIPYEALMPRKNGTFEFLPTDAPTVNLPGISLAPNSENSVDLAQSITAESEALAGIFNGLAKAFPSLGFKEIGDVALHQDLQGKPEEVAKKFKSGVRTKPSSTASSGSTQETTPVTTPEASTTPVKKKSPVTPDEIVRQDKRKQMKAKQASLDPSDPRRLTDIQIESELEDEFAPIDSTTGYVSAQQSKKKDALSLKTRSIIAAIRQVARENIETVFVSIDLANLGGINDFYNNNQNRANEAYREIADIIREELSKIPGVTEPIFMRTGGDELGVILSNAQPDAVREAMAVARQRVKAFAKAEGMDQIRHKKERIANFGIDIYSGVVALTQDAVPGDEVANANANEKIADNELDIQKAKFKKEIRNVNRIAAKAAREGTSAGQDGRGNSGSGTEGEQATSGTDRTKQGSTPSKEKVKPAFTANEMKHGFASRYKEFKTILNGVVGGEEVTIKGRAVYFGDPELDALDIVVRLDETDAKPYRLIHTPTGKAVGGSVEKLSEMSALIQSFKTDPKRKNLLDAIAKDAAERTLVAPTAEPVGEAQSVITAEEAAKLSDEDLNAKLDDLTKTNRTAVEEATFQVLYEEEGKRTAEAAKLLEEQAAADAAEEARIKAEQTVTPPVVQTPPAPTPVVATPAAPAQPEATPEVAAEEVVAEEETPSLVSRITNLVTDRFSTMFVNRENKAGQSLSRLPSLPEGKTPMSFMIEALTSFDTLQAVLGKAPKMAFPSDVAAAYKKLLQGSTPHIMRNLNHSLETFLNKKYGQKTMRELLKEAEHRPANLSNGKALNIVEEVDGKLRYNQELIEAAILAAYQWMISASGREPVVDEDDIAKIAGVDYELVQHQAQELAQGFDESQIKLAVAKKIMQFWDIKGKKDAPMGFVDGIAEAVAAEVITALTGNESNPSQFINLKTVKITGPDGKQVATVNRYVVSRFENLSKYPNAIETVALREPEEVVYLAGDKPAVAKMRHNSSNVENTPDQLKAIEAHQEIVFTLDMPMVNAVLSLGQDAVTTLFGSGYSDPKSLKWMNKNYLKGLLGQNRTVSAAYEAFVDMHNQIKARAEVLGVKPEEVEIRYAANVVKTGRIHMQGKHNPQSNKLMRILSKATWSTLDLENADHAGAFKLAIGQALDIKIHKKNPEVVYAEVNALLKKMVALEAPIAAWLGDQQTKFPVQEMVDVFAAQKVPLTPAAFQAYVEHVRSKQAENKGAFRTSLSLEADGVTNGPINGLALLSIGAVTPEEIVNLQRGGISIGSVKKALWELVQIGPDIEQPDLYKESAAQAQKALRNLREFFGEHKNSADLVPQMNHLMRVSLALLPGMAIKIDDKGNQTIEFDRKLLKNPLTITMYGSSQNGIAGKLADMILEELYAKYSEATRLGGGIENLAKVFYPNDPNAVEKYKKLEASLNALFNQKIVFEQPSQFKSKEHMVKATQPVARTPEEDNLVNFTVAPQEYANLRSNLLHGLVAPMDSGIKKTLGSAVTAVEQIKKVTQIQSSIYSAMFGSKLKAAVEPLREARNLSQFISREQIKAIEKSLDHLAPLVRSGSQTLMLLKEKVFDELNIAYSKSFEDKFETPPDMFIPANVGVGGIPSTVISYGDAFMIMNTILQAKLKNALYVFDGIEMPLDKIKEYSEKINQIVLESHKQNPLKDITNMFSDFLNNEAEIRAYLQSELDALVANANEVNTKTKKLNGETNRATVAPALDSLVRTLWDSLGYEFQVSFLGKSGEDFVVNDEINLVDDIINAMKYELQNINDSATSVDYRHQAMQEVGYSVDHMAAAATPAHNGQPSLPDQTPEAIAEALNTRIRQLAANEEKAKRQKDIADLGVVSSSGARVLGLDSIKQLADKMNLVGIQRTMYQAILAAGKLNDAVVVTGSIDEINEYRRKQGFTPINDNGKTKGQIEFDGGKKFIFLVDPSNETMVHEFIHAATFETLVAYYLDPSRVSAQARQAIQNIEVLMEEFLANPPLVSSNQEKHLAVQTAIAQINARSDSKAAQLNEFMAWALANKDISTQNSKKLKDSVAKKLKRFADDVLKNIMQMLGLKEKSTLTNNLLFNTLVLVPENPNLEDLSYEASLFHSTDTNPEVRLQNLEEMLNVNIERNAANIVRNNPKAVTTNAQEHFFAERHTQQVAQVFTMTAQEKNLFQTLVAAMTTLGSLDSSVLSRMNDLYEHVISTLTPEDLADADITDPGARAYQGTPRYQLLTNKDAMKDADGRTAMLSTFVGLAMVNETFRQHLSTLSVPKRVKNDDKTLDAYAENFGNEAMDKLATLLSREKHASNVSNALDLLMDRLTYLTYADKSKIDAASAGLSSKLNKWEDKIVSKKDDLAEQAAEISDRLRASNNIAKKFAGVALGLTAGIASGREADKQAEAIIKLFNDFNVRSRVVVDMLGRTVKNANVYDMIKPVRALVQAVRQEYREKIPVNIANKFSKALSKEEYAAMFKALAKTDFAALLGSNLDTESLVFLFTDRNLRDDMIATLEEQIQQTAPRGSWPIMQRKMEQLANYMNTGIPGNNLLRNAEAVANLFDEVPSYSTPTPELIAQVDKLTSLYAIRSLPQDTKDTMASLVRDEVSGVKFTINYLINQRKDEMVKLNDATRFNYFKGHIISEPTNDGDLIVADDNNRADLEFRGYTRIGDYVAPANDVNMSRRGYYFSNANQRPAVSQGIAQNIRHTAFGVDTHQGFATFKTAGRVTGPRNVERLRKRMQFGGNQAANMMPVRDETGAIIAFERSIDPAYMAYLAPSENLAKMLGIWRGRQIEEELSKQVNEELAVNLKKMWDEDKKTAERKNYIELSINNPKLTAVEKDAIKLFSPTVLSQLASTFGDEAIMVRKDLFVDVVGYRNASVGDFFTGNTEWGATTQDAVRTTMIAFGGKKAYAAVVNTERRVQTFMIEARQTIVVKSVVIPMINIMSNMLHLVSRGVPFYMVGKGSLEKMSEIHTYTKSLVRKTQLEVDLRGETNPVRRRNIEAQLQAIDESHQRLSIWPLLKAGEFTSIADVGMTSEDLEITDGRLAEWVEKQVSKLPAPLQTAARYGYVSRDTALFRGLQKSVQYGDFVAKAILFDHLTQNKGKTDAEALAQVTEEFVNYDRLPGRSRATLENIGLLWFYNFKLRTAKVALSVLRNNPLHALLSMNLPVPDSLGTALEDNIFSVLMSGNLSYSIGPGMALHAINLNPWVNLVD